MKNEENKEEVKTNPGSRYRKVENKKHKTGITIKRFILIVLLVILILGLIIAFRWKILSNIQENYNKTTLLDNWYYYSETDSTIMKVYRKGSIWKMNTRQKNGDGNLTFWKDISTGEAYIFYEDPIKKYTEDKGGMVMDLPSSGIYTQEERTRVLMSATPTLWIGTANYNGIDSYIIEIGGHREYIDKQTGLLLATFEDNMPVRVVEYEIGSVFDSDVEKPDVSEYEYLEQ